MQKHHSHSDESPSIPQPVQWPWDDLRYFLAVARAHTATAASRTLGVNYTTVSRRIRALEQLWGTVLFEKSRTGGFVLTPEGERLLPHVEAIESRVLTASEQALNENAELQGHIRLACTEAFGSVFLAPRLGRFLHDHPKLSIDLMPLPHFASLSKREADLLITLERPEHGAFVSGKLCDYDLGLYASASLLKKSGPVNDLQTLLDRISHQQWQMVSYIDERIPSEHLNYLTELFGPHTQLTQRRMRSTSVLAQANAVRAGWALGVLPCFLAHGDPQLVRLLPKQMQLTKTFWLCCREDLWDIPRIKSLWHFLCECTRHDQALR